MYCSVENSESNSCICINRCSILYTIALAFLAAIFLFLIGLAVGSLFAAVFADLTAAILVAAGFIAVVFIVTWLTKSSCNSSRCG